MEIPVYTITLETTTMSVGPWLAGAVLILQASSLLPVGAFRIAPPDSHVEFVMRDNRGGFVGMTDRVDGTVIVAQADPDTFTAVVEARIDARTLDTGIGLRNGQMRRDFLQTDRHPFIVFRGTAVSQGRLSGGVIRAVLRGSLAIRGTTREIEMPLSVTALADEYRATGEITLRLSDYGIPSPRFLVFVAEDPVTVRLRVFLRRSS